jgi:hypothetical protein
MSEDREQWDGSEINTPSSAEAGGCLCLAIVFSGVIRQQRGFTSICQIVRES